MNRDNDFNKERTMTSKKGNQKGGLQGGGTATGARPGDQGTTQKGKLTGDEKKSNQKGGKGNKG
jgi:hypothetical protein